MAARHTPSVGSLVILGSGMKAAGKPEMCRLVYLDEVEQIQREIDPWRSDVFY